MAFNYNRAQQLEYFNMTQRQGVAWLEIFKDDTEFYSAAYWDLFTNLWRQDKPTRKTDAMGFMKAVKSAHTAGKYIDTAIRRGFLIETENPEDARSKLIELSPQLRENFEVFINRAVDEILLTGKEMAALGSVPKA
ncbi:MAG: hypothetical protein RIB59_12110 [Rhodospirillales bacterium]